MKLTVDAVVFGYVEDDLKILLIKRKYEPFSNCWALPGGFVSNNESLESAVLRELKEETSIENIYLEQLYTFGNIDRDPRERIVSVAYYGLVKPEKFIISATTDASDVKWFSVNEIPDIAFDHKVIIDKAHSRLKSKLRYEPIGFELLPDKFPFSKLQKMYETIIGMKFDRRNFRKKFLKLEVLSELNEKQIGVSHKAGHLFMFNLDSYNNKKKTGFYFEI